MLRNCSVRICTLWLLVAAAGSAHAGFLEVENIVQCMRSNIVQQAALREMRATTISADGKRRETALQMLWRTRESGAVELNLQVLAPDDIAGIAYLLKPTDKGLKAWLYLPALDSIKKVSADQLTEAIWGTEFSYAQFRQLLGMLMDGDSRRRSDDTLDGRPVYVLDTKPEQRRGPYSAVRSYIDKQSCVLLRAEYLSPNGELQQILSADAEGIIKTNIDGRDIWLVQAYTITNLNSGQTSTLHAGSVQLMDRLSSSAFNSQSFYQAVRLNN